MKFIDTPESARDREARRRKVAEIQKKEALAQAKEDRIKTNNRKVGQHQLGETTLSHFGNRR